MKKKKRRLRKEIRYFLIGLIVIIVPILVFSSIKHIRFMKYDSVNANSSKILKNHCLAFYPDDVGRKAKEFANDLCKDVDDNSVFDYTMSTLGEYYYIDYGNEAAYLVTKDMQEPTIGEISTKAKMIISDYLRYTMKSNGLDYAYTLSFLEDSYYENIKDDSYTMKIDGKNLLCHFNEYEVDVKIPLKYIGSEIGIDLGLNEKYIKPRYIDPDRKAVAFTFDDGPSLDENATSKIINTLYKYDGAGTFFLLGNRLYEKTAPIIADGIEKANQYGSHSCTHRDLRKLEKDEMYAEVMDVAVWLKDNFNYNMNVYRPPYGNYNAMVDETIPVAGIFWDVDSNDWSYRDAAMIHDEVMKDVADRKVILMHDIYDTTASALADNNLIHDLINDGYQLVTVDEMAKLKGLELKQGIHMCWGD